MPIKTQQDEQPSLNLTPMIDVVFLLIIFFMVATKFSELDRNIELQLPQVAESGDRPPPPQPKIVSIYADGHIELDGITVTPQELTARLTEARRESARTSVVIQGDAKSSFQAVAAALAACQRAEVSELGITVEVAARLPAGGNAAQQR